jgi:hypothetical protein
LNTENQEKQMNIEYKKINHELPSEIATRLAELKATLTVAEWKELRASYASALRGVGWTLQSVADLFGWSRERVRQVYEFTDKALAEAVVTRYGLSVPELPMKPLKPKPVYVEPSPETLTRLLELKPMAMAVRSFSSEFREEAEEYTALLNHAHTVEGVTLYRLAKRLGVTHGALRFRLARYGYKPPINASSKVYKPVLMKNRAI